MKKVRPHCSGFSLLELMVSMSIGMALLVLAAGVLGKTGDGYERLNGNLHAEREARAALNQLKIDIESASHHAELICTKETSGWARDSIGFFSFQSSDAQSETGHIGDLCAIHYYLRTLTLGGKSVRCLMRGFRESDETFQALRDGKVANLFTPQDRDEPVAFGALAFEVLPKILKETGEWGDWEPTGAGPPDRVILRLTLARRNLASQLKNPADWDQTGGLFGSPAEAENHPQLEFYETAIRFGHHEKF